MRIHATALLAALALAGCAKHIDFTAYHTPTQIGDEMDRLEKRFPDLVRIVSLGSSVQGRPIRAIKISDHPTVDDPTEADVVFVALHHAREWLATETALYVAEQIALRYETDPQVQADVDAAQVWIIPVMNPDGYAFTVAPGGDRYWRKNRRLNGDGSRGVDLNRNWSYQWGLMGMGVSGTDDPTVETYFGTGPFSEPETQVIRDFLNSRAARLESFVSYHTYGEMWLRPWNHTLADPPGEGSLRSIYERSRDVIQAVHGTLYTPDIGYRSGGDALDWVWSQHRAAAFTPELRPRVGTGPGGQEGFSPPADSIIPTGEESLPAALALLHDAADTEVWIKDHPADTGEEPSAVWTGSGWSHAFWLSPDIWVDAPELVEGSTVELHVRVRNAAGVSLDGVTVEAYWTDPSISTEFPSAAATPIGTQTVTVPAAGLELTIPWTVPAGTNASGDRHWCVGVVLKHARDMPLTTRATRSSNVAYHNFWAVAAPMAQALTVSVTAMNFLDMDAELRVVLGELPNGWRAQLPDPRTLVPDTVYGPLPRDTSRVTLRRKGRLLQATGTLLRPGERVIVPVRVIPPPGAAPGTTADVHIHGALVPLVAGERPVMGNGFTYRVTVRGP